VPLEIDVLYRPIRNVALLVISVTFVVTGCSSSKKSDEEILEELAAQDKESIFALAEDLYQKKKYNEARKYFSFVYDTFPNDPLGHKAALRVADTYAVKSDPTNLTEARLRYRDFANRYPNDPDRDYALLMVGDTFSRKKIRPDRDLDNLHEAYDAFRQLVTLYPNSEYAPQAQEKLSSLRETLAEHEYLVAKFYYRNKRWHGALWRLEYLKENYPDYSKMDEVDSMFEGAQNKITEIEETFRKLLEDRRKSTED
jgi:outer membrane protein assembly factor BamD